MRSLSLLLVIAITVALGLRVHGPTLSARLTGAAAPSSPAHLDTGRVAPELANDSWLNTDRPLRLADLRGRVVLLNFWVYTCGNCTRSLPSLIDFDGQYRDRGLTIIGIHTPEFPPYSGEHDRENVRRVLRAYGIKYPVAQDNDRRTWDAYGIRYWPSYVLLDRRGRIRYADAGEFHENDATHRQWSRRIEALLDEHTQGLHVAASPGAGGTRLTLVAEPGTQINARLKPALELRGGAVLRFDSPHLTADSAYFADAPDAFAPAGASLKGAILRASVCSKGERVCRTVTLPINP